MQDKLYILCGGPNTEHEISIESGKYLYTLASKIYNTYLIILPKINTVEYVIDILKNITPDTYVINALHGSFGEGGLLTSIISAFGLKILPSLNQIAIDKHTTLLIANRILNIPILQTEIVYNQNDYNNLSIPYPRIIKPNNDGSSYYIDIDNGQNAYQMQYAPALVSTFLSGAIDLSVSILSNKVINVVAISYDNKEQYFSNKAKNNFTVYHADKTIGQALYDQVASYALSLSRYLRCEHIARVDFIYYNGNVYMLEINNIPGMTDHSIIFQALRIENRSDDEVIKELVHGLTQTYIY